MNTATQNLENDHVYILRLIDVMEKMVLNCATDTAHMELVVNLIKTYADGFHHAKEEQVLFPLLEEKGFSKVHGPVAVMLHEHVEGREFVKGISQRIDVYKAGNVSALPEIYQYMQGYVDLLHEHISKENNVLFKLADKALSSDEQLELLNKFGSIEKQYDSEQIAASILEIEGLEAFYMEDVKETISPASGQ
jgi:hemerythrin-like domain-containing protein